MNKVTIEDVAKEAQVSISTVSRVMSNSDLISEKTKKHVKKIIKQLNYVPNSAAQNLTNSKTNILGIVLNSSDIDPLSNNFFSEILENISEYLLKNGYYTMYIHCNSNKEEMKYIKSLIASKRIDGLLFLRAYTNESIFKYLKKINFPFTILGKPQNESQYLWVDNDNFEASYKVTKNLINKNCKNFCFVGGSLDLNVTKYRYEGYEKALKESGLVSIDRIETNFDLKTAYTQMKKAIKNIRKFDAIVTTDDVLAIAIKRILEKDNNNSIKISGFNNSELRRIANYKFLTVEINIKKLAYSLCELLLLKLHNKSKVLKNNYIIVETSIVEER